MWCITCGLFIQRDGNSWVHVRRVEGKADFRPVPSDHAALAADICAVCNGAILRAPQVDNVSGARWDHASELDDYPHTAVPVSLTTTRGRPVTGTEPGGWSAEELAAVAGLAVPADPPAVHMPGTEGGRLTLCGIRYPVPGTRVEFRGGAGVSTCLACAAAEAKM